MSTFLVESSERTFFASDFDKMSEEQTCAALERLFADTLGGHALIRPHRLCHAPADQVWRRTR
jgi:hypothetical protein